MSQHATSHADTMLLLLVLFVKLTTFIKTSATYLLHAFL